MGGFSDLLYFVLFFSDKFYIIHKVRDRTAVTKNIIPGKGY